MRLTLKLFVFLCFLPVTVLCQEKITKMMAGPNGETFRAIVAFVEPTDESFKTQTLIIDVNPVKNKKEQPTTFYVDLTSTIRSISTGDKKQKILVLRWDKSGDIEVKCEGNKWEKENAGPELDKIVETAKAVIQNAPLDTKGDPVEFKLPEDLEQRVISILNGLETSSLKCVRDGN